MSYTVGMTHRVGPKGQVVIPKELRDELGILPGDLVDFERVEGGVVVHRVPSPRQLMGRFSDGPDLVADLMEDKRRERERERRRGR